MLKYNKASHSFCSYRKLYLIIFGRSVVTEKSTVFTQICGKYCCISNIRRKKEKLVDLIQTDDGFQNMKTETVVMLNTLTNSKLKFNEEKEETSMCLAIDELREEAKQEGIEIGRRELIEKMLMNHETMDKIKEYTGYTQEKIDEIAKELSAR